MVEHDMASRNHRTTCTSGENPEPPAGKLNPVEMLRQLHWEGGGLTGAAAINYMEEIREDRKRWRAGELSNEPKSHMEQGYSARIDSLCRMIDEAFDGVILGEGIGLWEAQGLDDDDEEETCAKYRAKDEKEDWRKITDDDLNACSSSPSFFDAAGFRFHLAAFMQAELHEALAMKFYYSLISFKWLKYEPYLFLNPKQRMAVREFLLFQIEDGAGGSDRPAIELALTEYWTAESCRSVS